MKIFIISDFNQWCSESILNLTPANKFPLELFLSLIIIIYSEKTYLSTIQRSILKVLKPSKDIRFENFFCLGLQIFSFQVKSFYVSTHQSKKSNGQTQRLQDLLPSSVHHLGFGLLTWKHLHCGPALPPTLFNNNNNNNNGNCFIINNNNNN